MSRNHLKLDARRWQAVRRRMLTRAQYRCAKCNRYGKEVDHIKPLADFPDQDAYAPDGLQVLCRSCHIAKTARENRARYPIPEWRLRWRALVFDT